MGTVTEETRSFRACIPLTEVGFPMVPLPVQAPSHQPDSSPVQPQHDESCAIDSALAADPYQRLLAESQRRHRLVSVHWELTYRCNERCTHCYLDVLPPGAHVPGELTTEEALNLVDQIADEGALNLTLSGGEVLVRRDFFEIAERARARRLVLRIFTNGTLITPEKADRIAALHPYAVEISVYGACAETHDRITQIPGSYHRTIRALELLHERGVRTVAKTPLMRDNVHEFDALREQAARLGARFQYDITITTKDSGGLSPLAHRMTDEQLLDFLRRELDPTPWLNPKPRGADFRFCGIGGLGCTIGPNGDVFSCVGARIRIGNVRQAPLRTIWRESPVWKELYDLTLSRLPECATCELKDYCTRCHGEALIEDGDLFRCSSIARREALFRRQVLQEKGVIASWNAL